jgi:hypothetical protein
LAGIPRRKQNTVRTVRIVRERRAHCQNCPSQDRSEDQHDELPSLYCSYPRCPPPLQSPTDTRAAPPVPHSWPLFSLPRLSSCYAHRAEGGILIAHHIHQKLHRSGYPHCPSSQEPETKNPRIQQRLHWSAATPTVPPPNNPRQRILESNEGGDRSWGEEEEGRGGGEGEDQCVKTRVSHARCVWSSSSTISSEQRSE